MNERRVPGVVVDAGHGGYLYTLQNENKQEAL